MGLPEKSKGIMTFDGFMKIDRNQNVVANTLTKNAYSLGKKGFGWACPYTAVIADFE